ncbi:helix-turn-helix domain-containing protein [Ferrimonas balearica]|uniref:helix-turn-helix domain-containing protein n=1 Tax=Ferrimonas balearica TaxID=44012 RepID=UPI001C99FC17|nr:helix-turn-helix domain-containing protein [Ferrimonas balearica]MBY5921525.1 helix-turn-helix domain-containing protein [Ferrimonas balearica]MBY5995790.1 helix-turn-helix domain-containing protein [Ferrimonas balearica]
MSKKDAEIRSKLALLQLVEELGSVSKACEIMGYSRDSYYRFKKQFDEAGPQGLKNLSKKRSVMKNRLAPEVEAQVIEIALDYPNYGQSRVAELLTARGCIISPSGVRSVWLRHNLETKKNRLLALQNQLAQRAELDGASRDKMEMVHRLTQDMGELECQYPGELWVQDTFAINTNGGLGTLYQHTFIDAYTQLAFVRLSADKDARAAQQFLHEGAVPWCHTLNLPIDTILTDKGAEFFGPQSGPYQTMIAELGCKHIHMRAYNGPVVNGLAARFQSLMNNEFYAPLFKSSRVEEIATLQAKLDQWLSDYNQSFAVSGRYTLGKAPMQTLQVSRHLIPQHCGGLND